MKWSSYQESIFSAVAADDSNLIVNAVAGSGKTTTNVEIARRANRSGMALAFNKRIAEELNARLVDSPVQALTLNALGHRAWQGSISGRLRLDSDKLFSLAKEIGFPNQLVEVVSLTRAAKSAGLVPSGLDGAYKTLVEDTPESWEHLISYYDIDLADYEPARDLLKASINAARMGYIDFDDQLYMPTLFGGRWVKQDLILIDESQDLSALQHAMLRRIAAPTSRVVAVGDPWQAIYGFRGACDNSMTALGEDFQMKPLPLSVCYRCGKNIVAEARQVVPHIEHYEYAEMGLVENRPKWATSGIPPASAILCRNNAPLMEVAMQLISEHRPVNFLGRDICKGLLKLIDKIARVNSKMTIEQFGSALIAWEDREVAMKPKSEARVRDKADSLRALAEGARDISELKSIVGKLQANRADAVVLSSIHRAKGFEWDVVFFLDSFRIPSKYATQAWQLQQEENCRYIAITRAKRELYYVEGAPK